jgi:hypothetical protein
VGTNYARFFALFLAFFLVVFFAFDAFFLAIAVCGRHDPFEPTTRHLLLKKILRLDRVGVTKFLYSLSNAYRARTITFKIIMWITFFSLFKKYFSQKNIF